MNLNLIPITNFVFWFVVYAVAAYLLVLVLSRLEVLKFKQEPVSSAAIGLVSTILDAAATSSSQGPVTNLSLLPTLSTVPSQVPAIPPYLGTVVVFVVAFVIIYLVAKD